MTADLCVLLRHSGLRVEVEALKGELELTLREDYALISVKGKGGHEREAVVVDPEAVAIASSAQRLQAFRRVPYRTHHERWKKACIAAGCGSKVPTLHSLRHAYATEIYRRTGDSALVQQLLGHADPRTTSGYIAERDSRDIVNKLLR